MAEARQAVSAPGLKFSYADEALLVRVDRNALSHFVKTAQHRVSKYLSETGTAIYNGVWPARPRELLPLITTTFTITHFGDQGIFLSVPGLQYVRSHVLYVRDLIPWPQGTGLLAKDGVFSALCGTAFFVVVASVRRYIMRALLSYRGWMYEPPKKQSYATLAWGGLLKLVTGKHPYLYSLQGALPGLPVPPVKQTVDGFLESVRPVMNDAEYDEIAKKANKFLRGEANKLNRLLWAKSWISSNYVTDWWEKYVYLAGRTSIMINSNYYVMDSKHYHPTTDQVARVAQTIARMLEFKRQIDSESLEPFMVRNMIPMCMDQYRRMFSCTRIPHLEQDELRTTAKSNHITVRYKGRFYYMSICHMDVKQTPLSDWEIERQLRWIVHDADSQPPANDNQRKLAALTAWDRDSWAKGRRHYFSEGINKSSLDAIEKGILFLSLDDDESGDSSAMGHQLIHGDGTNRWFDKSITLVSFKNGRIGLNCEHSWADAPVIAHMWEYCVNMEYRKGAYEDGKNKIPRIAAQQTTILPAPQELEFTISSGLADDVSAAYAETRKAIEEFDLYIMEHNNYGKGFIKKCGVSPDAYIQLAFQIAYYRDQGQKFGMTYESSMTRLYRQGRTETVRACTNEARAFVLGFEDSRVSKKEKVALMRKAADRHQRYYRDAMSGKGVDRHLFALYVASRGMGVDSDFLKSALSLPWKLSTSQQPQQQTNLWDLSDPRDLARVSPGGGFGPVADDGYGVSYMIAGDALIYFHISSKKSAVNTNSRKFANHLDQVLTEMRTVFEDAEK
eukprot:Clim_evm37s204 gene=Clim_evmTU37s204